MHVKQGVLEWLKLCFGLTGRYLPLSSLICMCQINYCTTNIFHYYIFTQEALFPWSMADEFDLSMISAGMEAKLLATLASRRLSLF